MTVYVVRDGKLVEKHRAAPLDAPRISRFEGYESPVDGKFISSDRQRERDLYASDSFDARDLSPDHQWRRGRDVQKKEADAARAEPQQRDFWR
jgi:hypothetical protein